MKAISIITVVKNNKKGIEKTIRSVLGQNQKNIEYIVVDSMSTDGTSEIILKYKSNLIYLRQPDKNLYMAINKGIKKASGKYIVLLHSGDKFFNSFSISSALNFIKNYNLDVASFSMNYISNNKIIRKWNLQLKKLTEYNFFKIAHPTLIIKTKIAKKLGYSEKYLISGDADFLLRLSKIENIKYKFSELLFQQNQYGGISTNNKNLLKKITEDLKIIKKYHSYLFIFIYFLKIFSKLPTFFFNNKK